MNLADGIGYVKQRLFRDALDSHGAHVDWYLPKLNNFIRSRYPFIQKWAIRMKTILAQKIARPVHYFS